MELSVVVPTYRGAESLPHLVTGLGQALLGRDWELILVNDCSPDDTWRVVCELAEADPRVRGIDLLTNHGQIVATQCGLAAARGDLVATMDDDLQHPPDQLPLLVDHLQSHPELDAVIGSWDFDQGFGRNLGSKVFAAVDRIANGGPAGFRYTAFRVMRRAVAEALVSHETRAPAIGPLLTQTTRRVANVEVRHDARAFGSSTFRFTRGLSIVANTFLRRSTRPQQVSGAARWDIRGQTGTSDG